MYTLAVFKTVLEILGFSGDANLLGGIDATKTHRIFAITRQFYAE
jgi:hypothetical protein